MSTNAQAQVQARVHTKIDQHTNPATDKFPDGFVYDEDEEVECTIYEYALDHAWLMTNRDMIVVDHQRRGRKPGEVPILLKCVAGGDPMYMVVFWDAEYDCLNADVLIGGGK